MPKAAPNDFPGRFREIVSDPLNLMIERVPEAGLVENGLVTLHNGNKVPIIGPGRYYGDFSMILVINRGIHEPLEEYVFQEVIKVMPEAPVMLELGCYWAHYSMWLKRFRPHARNFMVEPDAQGLAIGQSNFSLNKFEGTFIQDIVDDKNFKVDAFMAEQGLEKLDVLHCDIQGYETLMIEHAQETLRRRQVDYLFVSTHSGDIHRTVQAQLTQLGYRIEISSDFDHDTTSYDGLVFATSPNVEPLTKQIEGPLRVEATRVVEEAVDRLRRTYPDHTLEEATSESTIP